jgi:uncharacterized small protein (DUF1192 family)
MTIKKMRDIAENHKMCGDDVKWFSVMIAETLVEAALDGYPTTEQVREMIEKAIDEYNSRYASMEEISRMCDEDKIKLVDELATVKQELSEARKTIAEWADASVAAAGETCGDEKHCTCVPLLRQRIKEQAEELARVDKEREMVKASRDILLEASEKAGREADTLKARVAELEKINSHLLACVEAARKAVPIPTAGLINPTIYADTELCRLFHSIVKDTGVDAVAFNVEKLRNRVAELEAEVERLKNYMANAINIGRGKLKLQDMSFHSWNETVTDMVSLLESAHPCLPVDVQEPVKPRRMKANPFCSEEECRTVRHNLEHDESEGCSCQPRCQPVDGKE